MPPTLLNLWLVSCVLLHLWFVFICILFRPDLCVFFACILFQDLWVISTWILLQDFWLVFISILLQELWFVFLSILLLPYLWVFYICILLQYPWDVLICFLAVFAIIFGIIYWLVNRGNRNLLTKPIQQEYTEQEDRELVLLCNKHILEIRYIYVDNDIPYMVEAQRERQINFRNSLFVI